jgi:hypothetical protein
MTKHIHIINGDSSKEQVKIPMQDMVYDYDKKEFSKDWQTVEELPLDNSGSLNTKYITSTRRLVIEENGSAQ